jgi:type II secretory ATPase GspE/PulE/Tfp pilus assembly ATPase PilB-like protein
VSSSVLAVMAQRLLRRVCDQCRRVLRPTAELLREIGLTPEQVPAAPLCRGRGLRRLQGDRLSRPTGIHELPGRRRRGARGSS